MIILLMLCGKTRAPGGILRCILSMVLEVLMSTCLAPMFSIITLWSTIKVLRGLGSGWDAQDRDGRAITWLEIVRSLGTYGLVAALVPIAYVASGAYNAALVSLPFFASIVLAVPLAKLSSSPKGGGGDWTRKHKLFMSPYEMSEVPEADLDGAEQRLKKELAAFEESPEEPSEDLSQDKSSSAVQKYTRPSSRELFERLSSWQASSKDIHVGMRGGRIVSHAAEEFKQIQVSNELPLARSDAEANLIVNIEHILSMEPDAEIPPPIKSPAKSPKRLPKGAAQRTPSGKSPAPPVVPEDAPFA